MNRPKYKALYRGEQIRAARLSDRLQAVRAELERVRSVLAREGYSLIVQLRHTDARHHSVKPLEYECVSAALRAQRCFASEEDEPLGFEVLTIRGVPVVVKEER